MSTLSEHTGNGNPTKTNPQREDAKEQIDGLLQHFDVLPSKFDRFLFRYIYVYLIGLFLPTELLFTISLLGMNPQVGRVLLAAVGLGLLPMVFIIFVVWSFNVWRLRTPKTLRDLLERKCIALPDSDANESYLSFLEHYRNALVSPKRYVLSGFLMIIFGILTAYGIKTALTVEHPNIFMPILIVGYLFSALLYLGGLYCIGIVTWVMYISGLYVRKLVRVFQLRIQPFHSDLCGGLKVLGNFCFGLITPLLIGFGFIIGLIIFALLVYSPGIYGSENSAVYLAINVGLPLVILLLYILPVIVLAFMLPLRDIHTKMVSEGDMDEDAYNVRMEALREEIQAFLDVNQVDAAKALQEKKALVETLHTPYPTWPFRFRSKIFSTVLGVSGSLLLGLMTAALQMYFLPAILTLLVHNP